MLPPVIIPERFRGPPGSANGGYACGALATLLGDAVEVTLRSPPPLDTPLQVRGEPPGALALHDGETLVAEARPVDLELDVPAPVAFDAAVVAARSYAGFEEHPYPTCFTCGPGRAPGDGLRIFPGPVEGRGIAAAPWSPDSSVCDDSGLVRPEVVWAALDCPSWFGIHVVEGWQGTVLLGRLAGRIAARPRAGSRCVAVGWFLGREGRKLYGGSAVISDRGEILGEARATWLSLGSPG